MFLLLFTILLEIPSIELSDPQAYIDINSFTKVYHTPDTLTGIEAYLRIKHDQMPLLGAVQKAPSSLSEHSFWILFKTINLSSKEEVYHINFTFNRTDSLTLYEIDDTVRLQYKTGDVFPFDQRPVQYRSFIFPIALKPGEEKTWLLNADKRGTIDRFPMRIMSASFFEQFKSSESIRFGLSFGFFLTVALVSFFIGIGTRKTVFVFYGLYAFFIGIYLLNGEGLFFQYITPHWPEFNYYNLLVFGSWAMVFFSFYGLYFFRPFDVQSHIRRLQIIVSFALIAIVNIPFLLSVIGPEALRQWLIDQYTYPMIGNYIGVLLIFIFNFIHALSAIKNSGWLSPIFLTGMLASFSGITYSILVDNAVIDDNFFTDNSDAILIGFLIEVALLSIAMVIFLQRTLDPKIANFHKAKYRELHHRVKNNLQVISSLMSLHARQSGDETVTKIVANSRERLQAMSLVHQQLYLQDDIDSMDIKAYLETLVKHLHRVYNDQDRVAVETHFESHFLDIDTITNVGMIVNELIINAFKYAFPESTNPCIVLSFQQKQNWFLLEIRDNGIGLPEQAEAGPEKSFGLRLVELLVEKLQAEMSVNAEQGLHYTIRFQAKN